jgi:hypothetical protein
VNTLLQPVPAAGRCAEGIANEDDPGLPVSLADIEIDRADFDVAGFDIAGQCPQAQ